MKLGNNSLFRGASGMMGGLVFKQLRGQTIVTTGPRRRSTKPTPKLAAQQEKFRHASAYAKAALNDPARRNFYEAVAGKSGSPYQAAMRDFLTGERLSDAIENAKPETP